MSWKDKEDNLLSKWKNLSESEFISAKIIFHNYIDFEYEEIEEKDEITPFITERKTGEKHNFFDYIKDKSNIINSTHYINGVRRPKRENDLSSKK